MKPLMQIVLLSLERPWGCPVGKISTTPAVLLHSEQLNTALEESEAG
jgi:hypothetical protein